MFYSDYHQAKTAFLELVASTQGQLTQLPVGNGLTIDVGTWGASENALLVTSGVHGVEGHVGSAIQRSFISSIKDQLGKSSTTPSLIMVHVVNPWGMVNNRRVNQYNVDLNRNFLGEHEPFAGAPSGYKPLDNLLNPTGPKTIFDMFTPRALWAIATQGMPALKSDIAGGQYEFEKGLFFGGKHKQTEAAQLTAHFVEIAEQYNRIIHLDLHSGLGKFGDLSLISNYQEGSESLATLRRVFNDSVQDSAADSSVGYKIRGSLPASVQDIFGANSVCMTCEFGTFSPIDLLKVLRAENRATQHSSDPTQERLTLLNTLCPPNKDWREGATQKGVKLLHTGFASLASPI